MINLSFNQNNERGVNISTVSWSGFFAHEKKLFDIISLTKYRAKRRLGIYENRNIERKEITYIYKSSFWIKYLLDVILIYMAIL